MSVEAPPEEPAVDLNKLVEERESITVRFAGDSGDGMQQTGLQFTNTSAIFGNDICTLPDFPAEIRAPAGTVYGVSGFQVHFSAEDIHTPGDELDCLVVMNPAALKTNIGDLREEGIIIANVDGFTDNNLKLAGYGTDSNPLEDGTLDRYRLHKIPVTSQNRTALDDFDLKTKQVDLCKNYYALGILCWLFNRPLEPVIAFLNEKFKKKPIFIEANTKALKSGYYYGETAEMFTTSFKVGRADLPPATYRQIGGNEATALGFVAAGQLAKKPLFYASYPITPASDVLHELSKHKEFDVRTFQAEDEIAAMASLIGSAYAGALSVTGTSGPGLALKAEALGLAVMTELPMVVINVQRGGPSTGLPTKTEAADLLQSMFGRNGECPVAIVAPSSPGNCFDYAIEAARIAIRHMIPVIFLSDGYLANGAEPWPIPDVNDLEPIKVEHPADNAEVQPYERDENNARPWILPGTKGLQHRVGGLEKTNIDGNVCYEPENHQQMINLRQAKVDGIAKFIDPIEVHGDADGGDLLILGWGSTEGAILQATNRARKRGLSVSCAQIHHLSPFPPNLEEVLRSYKQVLIPELNMGQLSMIIRAKYLIDAVSLPKVKGRPFTISEISAKIDELLAGE
jgi:2-oxoglutarate ferredoxin oxidoreductase subunit alpha